MTRPYRLLDDNQLDELGQLREQGSRLSALARHAKRRWGVDIHPNAISWQMLRIGADLPPGKRQAPRVGPMVVQRNGHVVRRYTPDDDRQLLALEAQGLSPSEIGRRMNPTRKQNSVRGRLMTLARHEARREETA